MTDDSLINLRCYPEISYFYDQVFVLWEINCYSKICYFRDIFISSLTAATCNGRLFHGPCLVTVALSGGMIE